MSFVADPCETQGCRAPYNVGCRVVDNKAQCICPTCANISRPVCASDDVQDLSECHLRRQACEGDIVVYTAKRGPCGRSILRPQSLVIDKFLSQCIFLVTFLFSAFFMCCFLPLSLGECTTRNS